MCGIVGIFPTRHNEEFLEQAKEDFEWLLLTAQIRGKDAAGAFVVSKKGEIFFAKSPGPATFFTRTGGWKSLMDKVDENTVAMVGHTRYETLGNSQQNENNHPLVDGDIVGVHNGIITNHRSLTQKYGSLAEVDSASMVASCRYRSEKEPLSIDTVALVAEELSGSFACVLADARRSDRIWIMRNQSSPVVLFKSANGIYFASTETILKVGVETKEQIYSVPPYSILEVARSEDRGKILTMKKFVPFVEPPLPVRSLSSSFRGWDAYGWRPFPERKQYPWLRKD